MKIPGQQGPRLVEKLEIDPVFMAMAAAELETKAMQAPKPQPEADKK